MRYVLDFHIGVKWVLAEDQSEEARDFRDEGNLVRSGEAGSVSRSDRQGI